MAYDNDFQFKKDSLIQIVSKKEKKFISQIHKYEKDKIFLYF